MHRKIVWPVLQFRMFVQNPYDIRSAPFGVSEITPRTSRVFSYIYELPFGKGGSCSHGPELWTKLSVGGRSAASTAISRVTQSVF